MDYGLSYEMTYRYSDEMKAANNIVKYLSKTFNITFPRSETVIMCMHILEAKSAQPEKETYNIDKILADIIVIIEQHCKVTIEDNFSLYRFRTHLQILLDRRYQHKISENTDLFEQVSQRSPTVYLCVKEIGMYLEKFINMKINEDEQLYLMLHINRLISIGDCY